MIHVDFRKPYFLLSFPYNKEDLAKVRSLPVREWDKELKSWKVPAVAVKSLDKLAYWIFVSI